METLYLQLEKHWFDQILHGKKHSEYRAITPHYDKKLFAKEYTHILFLNGYSKDAPRMIVELKKITKNDYWKKYELHLGKVISSENIRNDEEEILVVEGRKV